MVKSVNTYSVINKYEHKLTSIKISHFLIKYLKYTDFYSGFRRRPLRILKGVGQHMSLFMMWR